MTVLKKLPSREQLKTSIANRTGLRFGDGFWFGLGFWTAAFVFSFIIVPSVICMAALALYVLGVSLPG